MKSIAIIIGIVFTAIALSLAVDYACNDFKFSSLKAMLAKEVIENGICHIQIDDKFSVYFEDTSVGDMAVLYVGGIKTKYYSFTNNVENKERLVNFLLSDYYGLIGDVKEQEHYTPCNTSKSKSMIKIGTIDSIPASYKIIIEPGTLHKDGDPIGNSRPMIRLCLPGGEYAISDENTPFGINIPGKAIILNKKSRTYWEIENAKYTETLNTLKNKYYMGINRTDPSYSNHK